VGLYDYGARFYDPALGRFLQPDSIVPSPTDPQSLNRYSYVRNNPLNLIDPSGHDDSWWGDAWGGFTGFVDTYILDPISSFGGGMYNATAYALGYDNQPSSGGFFYNQGASFGSLVGMTAGTVVRAASLPFTIAGDALGAIPWVGSALKSRVDRAAAPLVNYSKGVIQRSIELTKSFNGPATYAADELGSTLPGGLFANATGLTGAASGLLQSRDLDRAWSQIWDLGEAAVLRYGGTGGPGHPGTNPEFVFRNSPSVRSGTHDSGYPGEASNMKRAAADRELVNSLLTDIRHLSPAQPGPVGQAYRIGEIAVFSGIYLGRNAVDIASHIGR
jgi:hypothetical protein